MIRFNSDYLEGAHPRILEKLVQTNMLQTAGYGTDEICEEARNLIRQRCQAPNADVHFIVGGTQTNMIFLAAALKSYQGAICCETGHIEVHETGSIEATGHKVIGLPGVNGKILPETIDKFCRDHFSSGSHEHMVMPKVVYISDTTELGTIYSREELLALRKVCDAWHLYLYMDGARLGYALACEENDLDLPFIASVVDAFYIGGTKQGALFGEALVLINDALKADFRYIIKQRGAMLAKGRLLGLQFVELFRDDLYFEMASHAAKLALKLKKGFENKGYPFLIDSPSNQQFPIIPDAHLEILAKKYAFEYQERIDETHSAVRFCTSWATDEANVDQLLQDIALL